MNHSEGAIMATATVNTVNTATLPERIEHKMVGPAHVTVYTPASVYTDAPARANVHVAGVTFDNRQNKLAYINRMATKYHAWWRVVLRREPKNQWWRVVLRREPKNQTDPNAIAVHVVLITKAPDKSGKKQHWIKVGYLPKAYARLVHDINDIVVDNATINPWRDFKTGKPDKSGKKQHWIKVGYLPKAYARLVHDINDIVVDNATINPWRDFKTGKLSYSMKLHCINKTLDDQN